MIAPNLTALGYCIESKLGVGAQGTVWLARDNRLERYVVIKSVASSGKLDELYDEAKILARFSHPNLVTIYDILNTSDGLFLVMEYVKGQTLDRYLSEHIMSLEEKMALCSQLANGLAYVHQQGIIHCDLSCNNILVTSQGDIKLIDFGLGTQVEMCQVTHATPSAVSPEQLRGEVSPQSDIFCLGLLFFRIIALICPFNKQLNSPLSEQSFLRQPRDASQLPFALNSQFAKLLNSMIAIDQTARPQCMTSIASQLHEITQFEKERAVLALQTAPIATQATPNARVGTNENRNRYLLAAVLITLVLLTIAISMLSPVKNDPIETPQAKRLLFIPPNAMANPQSQELANSLYFGLRQSLTTGANVELISHQESTVFTHNSDVPLHQRLTNYHKLRDYDYAFSIAADCIENRCIISFQLFNQPDFYELQFMSWTVPSYTPNQALEIVYRHLANLFDLPNKSGLSENTLLLVQQLTNQYYLNQQNTNEMLMSVQALLGDKSDSPLAYRLIVELTLDKYAQTRDRALLEQTLLLLEKAPNTLANTTQLLHAKATMLIALKQFESANDIIALLDETEEPFYYHNLLGEYYYRQGQYDKALSQLTFAYELAPSLKLSTKLGYLHFLAGNIENAKMHISKVLEIDPNFPFALQMSADIAITQGDYKNAILTYEKLLTQNETAYDLANLAIAYIFEGRFAQALTASERASNLAPNNPEFLLNLADLTYQQIDYETAYPLYKQAIPLVESSNDNEKALLLTRIYTHLGEQSEAKIWLSKAEALDNTSQRFAKVSAHYYTRFNNANRALEAIERDINLGRSPLWYTFKWFKPLCNNNKYAQLLADFYQQACQVL